MPTKNHPSILGIIPARGGSRGIPHKNLVPLAGKPLLAYTCEAARAAKTLTRIVISTDSEEIAQCAGRYGVEAPFLRPASLAKDDTPMLEVLRHALKTSMKKTGDRPEAVILLQPTSPLRRSQQIDAAVRKLLKSDADSVVSVIAVPHQFTPSSLLKLQSSYLAPYEPGPLLVRRQDKPVLYARNGPAILAVRTRTLLKGNHLYGKKSLPFVMTWAESVDIDHPSDLTLAEFLLKRSKCF